MGDWGERGREGEWGGGGVGGILQERRIEVCNALNI